LIPLQCFLIKCFPGNIAAISVQGNCIAINPAYAQPDARTIVEAEGATSLARADKVTVKRGVKDRDVVRTRGANKPGFCPPGQESKPGLGSRFQC